ncbi:protein of unknown function [Methylocaldum szegediense]|mgnify:CR=1 FL=1|uniref:Uncharacterized protein n=1 Tax=Methylocaldum szegediense TaxID=73780 RepID=A0ABM9I133_9GAMM|nr:protein of unknown function [Methylocaldum szegediense]
MFRGLERFHRWCTFEKEAAFGSSEFEAGLAAPVSYFCKPLIGLYPQVPGVLPWTPACLGSAKASAWGLPFGPAFGCLK